MRHRRRAYLRHAHRHHHWKRLDRDEKIERLEKYQRDLEQAAADVASKIAQLREQPAEV